jgi:hypothetical protein
MVLLLVQLGVATEKCMAFVRVELSWGDSVGCKRACLFGRVEGRDPRNLTRTGRELGLLLLRKFGEIYRASTCHKSSMSWLEKTIRRSVCCSLRCCRKKQGGWVKLAAGSSASPPMQGERSAVHCRNRENKRLVVSFGLPWGSDCSPLLQHCMLICLKDLDVTER